MKYGTLDHPKMVMLASLLGISKNHAAGIVEHLFHWVGRYAPQGDIGKHPDEMIQNEIAPELPKKKSLVKALVESKWLDEKDWTPKNPDRPAGWPRLWVHDWSDHCEERVRLYLARAGEKFANGDDARKTRQSSDNVATTSRQCSGNVALRARAPEPVPVPEPEPVPRGAAPLRAAAGFFPSCSEWLRAFSAIPGLDGMLPYKKINTAEAEAWWMEFSAMRKKEEGVDGAVAAAWIDFVRSSNEGAFPKPVKTWRGFVTTALNGVGRVPRGTNSGTGETGQREASSLPGEVDIDEGDAEARSRGNAK